MRANQPVLVLAPEGESPPSRVSSSNAANRPAPKMDAPYWSSWRVPSQGAGLGWFAGIGIPILAPGATSCR
jgi:hypothetical protein